MAGNIYWRTRSATPRHQRSDLKEQSNQDQARKVIWRCNHTLGWGSTRLNAIDFKLPRRATRVCVFSLFILIDSCVNFAKYVESNHTHQEKVFHGKAWHIVSRSGTEISAPAVPTQEHGNCLVLEFLKTLWTLSVTRVYGIFNDLGFSERMFKLEKDLWQIFYLPKDFRKIF